MQEKFASDGLLGARTPFLRHFLHEKDNHLQRQAQGKTQAKLQKETGFPQILVQGPD